MRGARLLFVVVAVVAVLVLAGAIAGDPSDEVAFDLVALIPVCAALSPAESTGSLASPVPNDPLVARRSSRSPPSAAFAL